MISKELLSEVLGVNIKVVFYKEKYILICGADIGKDHIYNIYELAHKCKEWLRDSKNVMYDIRYYTNSSTRKVDIMTYGKDSRFFVADTEVEAIIRACEWILNNKSGSSE